MNRISPEALYRLLPAVHRIRDAEEGGPLEALIAVLAREGAVVEENIEQLLDDLFIETCADWAAPYVGGTIGYRTLHPIAGTDAGTRAEVANTIGYRRRKGTAAVLEQLARDVTGWPAHVVEYFRIVATCQHMNHIRPRHHLAPDLHDPLPLEALGRAFDGVSRTVDVRSIEQSPGRLSIGGRHNLPNIGLFLWRGIPMPHTRTPAARVDDRRHLFDALGAPRQLVNLPEPEDDIASISEPRHVPGRISRRALAADPATFYPRAFEIFVDDVAVPVARIDACDLSDDGPGWNHSPHVALTVAELAEIEGGLPLASPANALVRVDPELGRFAFPDPEPGAVRVRYHTGFPARIGGGEYNRAETMVQAPGQVVVLYPGPEHASLQAAVDAVSAEGGIVEITENDVFEEALAISADADVEVVVRARDGRRPVLRLPETLHLEGGANARIVLDGLVVERERVNVRRTGDDVSLGAVTLRHCMLIPGRGFTVTGTPTDPLAASLTIDAAGVELVIERSITGPLHLDETTNAEVRDTIVDAAAAASIDSTEAVAIRGITGVDAPAGALSLIATTVIGRILARSFPLVSDSILFARAPDAATAPVRALRRQVGCMRFSFVPDGSITPRRYRCQPQLAIDQAIAAAEAEAGGPIPAAERALITARLVRALHPSFTALSASHPAYAQLRRATGLEIRTGASDEGEMGAYHLLAAPQRETNLRIRLEEYLRFGLEAGIFYAT